MSLPNMPSIPVPHDQLVKYIAENPGKLMTEIMEPYRLYEARLRTVFAQDRTNPALSDPHINVLPLFTGNTGLITTRARDLASETQEERDRYIMPLPDAKRRPHGSPAVVANIKEFQKNFGIFSESSLVDMNWDNVVAAGSSVVNCLLPVPAEYNTTKRKLREYYHQVFCPASDVDLFLYGLTHEQAVEKIKQIEQAIRDAILTEVTVVRTKYAITIVSQYPTRHVQIVLRVYKSVGEILTGFDIDAAGGGYDGSQVFVTPRALGSFITQVNHVDLTRRSPSYENRLSKYSRRAFEIYWPELDRSRIDPTIFERSFSRCLGLARLLVLERLPTSSARDEYINKRRVERGRPEFHPYRFRLGGNIKDNFEDEVADWVSEADVSNYHTFAVPYGEQFHAKKIEKLCYTRDLLLNAEWNQRKERTVYLHRHPAFFGRVEDVIEDCCGTCPVPKTDEEKDMSAKEAEIYISGKVTFLIDDPGRQQIGSFNPLTENDWTDMAYVGNTARLCQSIVDLNADEVNDWLAQSGNDPNTRDYTGRTPLQLAAICSTPDVVRALVDNGARLTARLLDGRTALHLAATRGDAEIIKILMDKSNANEEVEEEKEDARRRAKRAGSQPSRSSPIPAKVDNDKDKEMRIAGEVDEDEDEDEDEEMEDDGEMVDDAESTADYMSMATGSFVNVGGDKAIKDQDAQFDGANDEPDFYKIDMLAWDVPCSPLHLAIVNGHEDAVRTLCDYGADSLLPVKFLNDEKKPVGAILAMVLAVCLPAEEAMSMTRLLLTLGATSSQADIEGVTAFHRFVLSGKVDLVDVLIENDKTGVGAAVKSVAWSLYNTASPLTSALGKSDAVMALRVLEAGANPEIDFASWLRAAKLAKSDSYLSMRQEHNLSNFHSQVQQPLLMALSSCPDPDLIADLLKRGADPNVMTPNAHQILRDRYYRCNYYTGETALDFTRSQLKQFRNYFFEKEEPQEPTLCEGLDECLAKYAPGTYAHWVVKRQVLSIKHAHEKALEAYQEGRKEGIVRAEGVAEKDAAMRELISDFEKIEQILIENGAKFFAELHPGVGHKADNIKSPKPLARRKKEEPWCHSFTFSGVHDMTDTRRDAYLRVFEAAWAGDLETIKKYTLGVWGPDHEESPLNISAVKDSSTDNNLFSIAFLRGHRDVARGILDIAEAQYDPDDDDKLAYRIKSTADADSDDGDPDSDEDARGPAASDSDDVKLVSRIVGDKKFVIDNIGEVSAQVKSKIRPIDLLNPYCDAFDVREGKASFCKYSQSLFAHVLETRDSGALNFLIDLGIHFSKPEHGGRDPEGTGIGFEIPSVDFTHAVKNGPVEMLADIIRRTGAGLPLDHLVKGSVLEINEKPKFYQGLSVYGKKRKDWANAGRKLVARVTGLRTAPVLFAAEAGCAPTTEWFQTEAPKRYYLEFCKSKQAQQDLRIRNLARMAGGYEYAISKWLGAQNDLTLHAAIMAPPTKDSRTLLKSLVYGKPPTLETKANTGHTPFLLACLYGRLDFLRILIKGGADQSARDQDGNNAVHQALRRQPPARKLRTLLRLLDQGLLPHFFKQRKNLRSGGATPLHGWITEVAASNSSAGLVEKNLEILRVLLEASGGAELEMLDGAGDTILHTCVMKGAHQFVEALLEFRPTLLLRENAVGRTPAEVARDFVTARDFAKPGTILTRNVNYQHIRQTLSRAPEEFVGLAKKDWLKPSRPQYRLQELAAAEAPQRVWAVMSKFVGRLEAENISKRRLVSLNEANDVAKRLGEQYRGADKTVNLRGRSLDHNRSYNKLPDDEKEDSEDADFVQERVGYVQWAWFSVEPRMECDKCGGTHGETFSWKRDDGRETKGEKDGTTKAPSVVEHDDDSYRDSE